MTEKPKPAPPGRYRVLCGGIEWGGGKQRVERGEVTDAIPAKSVGWLLASKRIEEVSE